MFIRVWSRITLLNMHFLFSWLVYDVVSLRIQHFNRFFDKFLKGFCIRIDVKGFGLEKNEF